MKIILDAMGGDNAPQAPVLGAIEAVKRYNADIILVGRGQEILEVLKKNGLDTLPEGVEIAHADDVVDMHDDPATVIHKRKNSSMIIGLKMLADGKGDAFVSAGSTGALLTGATLLVKRVRGHGSRHAHQGRYQGHYLRLRRQRRVHPGVSAPIRVGGFGLQQVHPGGGKSQSWPSEPRV